MEVNRSAASSLSPESVLVSAVLFCWHCTASSPSRQPLGWVILNEDKKSGMLSFGVCPDCLAREYQMPPSDN